MPLDLELHIAIRRNRLGQAHLHHRLVVFVIIIGMNELQLRRQVPLVHNFEFLDFLRAITFPVPFLKVHTATTFPLSFPHPG